MPKARKDYDYDSCNHIFPSRLRELMKKYKKTQDDLAEAINITRQSVSQYMDGSTLPRLDKFLLIAEYFNVSTDYLLGKVGEPTTDVNIQQFCEYTGLTENSVTKLWGVKTVSRDFVSVINEIIEHKSVIDFLSAIKTYKINCGKNYAVGKEDERLLIKYFGCQPADVEKYIEVSSRSVIEDLLIKIVDDISIITDTSHTPEIVLTPKMILAMDE